MKILVVDEPDVQMLFEQRFRKELKERMVVFKTIINVRWYNSIADRIWSIFVF